MPQIAQIASTYAGQFFWLLIVFGLIYFGIGRAMLPKIEATVDARNSRIADDLNAAERSRADADATEEAWRAKMSAARAEAQTATADAKIKGALATEKQVKAADLASGSKIAKAEDAIRSATTEALASIESAAAEAVQDIVAKLSGTSVTPAVAAAAVRKAMSDG
jgi:F-type H+-transporting ATPase subunit b